MADVQRIWGSATVDTDLTVGAIIFHGKSDTTGTTRTYQAQGTEANITLQVVPKGTGTFRVPTGYEANITDDRDIVNRAYANAHIGGKDVSVTLTSAGSGEDGYVVTWDNANSRFDLIVGGSSSLVIEDVTGTTYNFTSADNGKLKRFTNAAGCTATVPISLPTGWQVLAYRGSGAGLLTFASAGTLESAGTTLPAEKTMASVIHRGSDIHVLTGALTSGSGSVTSVGLSGVTGVITVTNSPIVGDGTIALSLDTQVANTALWGPTSGASAVPAFRAQVLADLPNASFDDVTGTTYTFLETDNHRIKRFTNAAGCLATIPTGLSVGWESMGYRASGAGALTFASAGTYEGVATTLSIEKTAAAILHRGSDIHVVIGAFGEGVGTANQLLATNNAGTEQEWKSLLISSAAVSNDVAWSLTTAGQITLNLPSASATDRGLVTAGAQTIAGAKTFNGVLQVGSTTNGVALQTAQGIVRLYTGSTSTDIGLSTTTTHLYTTLGWQLPSVKFTASGNTADASASSISGTGGVMNLAATTFQLNGLAGSAGKFFSYDGTWQTPAGGGGLPTIGSANQILAVVNAGGSLEYKTLSINNTAVSGDLGVTLTGANAIVINIPDAAAAVRGVITTGTQTLAGAKTFSSDLQVGNTTNGSKASASAGNVTFYSGGTSTVMAYNGTGMSTTVNWQFPQLRLTAAGTTTDTNAPTISAPGQAVAITQRYLSTVAAAQLTLTLNAASAYGAFTYGGLDVTTGSTPIGSGGVNLTYRAVRLRPAYNLTGGTSTITGIDYSPTETSLTGVTHYGLLINSTTAKSGFGLATPTAMLQTRGANNGIAFLADDDAGNRILELGESSGARYAKLDLGSDATGDIYRRNSSGNLQRLALGTALQVLRVNAGVTDIEWGNAGTGTPAGADTEIQINNSGAFGASGLFVPASGDLDLGAGSVSGTQRNVYARGTASDIALNISSKGTGFAALSSESILHLGDGSGPLLAQFHGINIDVVNDIVTLGNGATLKASDGRSTSIDGFDIAIKGGPAYTVSGNGNGGDVLIQSGLRRTAGSGVDGNITIDQLTGNLTVGTTNGKLGFFSTTAVVKQTSAANLTNNVTSGGTNDQIDDFTSLTVYATDAAAIRNAIYQLARKLKVTHDAMRLYGLLT